MASYDVNYNDKRFKAVEKEKNAAITESDKTYDSMISQSDKYFQKQIDAVDNYGETQKKNQQAQTNQTIKEIEQQKEQLHQDYLKEQTGAYTDWQKQSDDYGTNAEQMAQSGLAHTGYSESSQVAMYNQYQNRVATARETYVRAVQNYDNSITQARLQNNSLLAEIAFNTLQASLELSLQGFQYKNTLLQSKADAKRDINNTYYSRYQDVLSQINHENSMAEQIRQFNESQKLEQKKYNESVRQYNASLAEQKRQFNENLALQKKNSSVSSSGGSSSGSSKNTKKSTKSSKSKKSSTKSSSSNKKSSTSSSGSKKSTSSSNPKIDMNSVIALGYGPISASKLDGLVASGKVIQYVENGKLKFKNKPSVNSKDSFKTFLPNTAKKFGLK